MKLSSRLLRRIIILVIFLAVFGFSGYGLKKITAPAPTCNDGIQNGQEEGIDCGLTTCNISCEEELASPEVKSSKLIKVGENDYDFVAKIINPNVQYGAPEVNYELTLFDDGDIEVLKEDGVFYLLPIQEKFLVLTSLKTNGSANRSELKIKSATWQKLESLEGLNLIVRREKFSVEGSSSSLEAVIFNDSDFDFGVVEVQVLLLDSREDVIAVNRTDIRTFVSKTERYFKATWPISISRPVVRTEIRAVTNLFENANFVKRYGSSIERFQEYE